MFSGQLTTPDRFSYHTGSHVSRRQSRDQLLMSFSPHSLQDALNHIRNTTTQISAWMTTNLLHCMPEPFQNRIPHYWTPRAIKQISQLLRHVSDRSHFSCTLHFSSSQSRSHL